MDGERRPRHGYPLPEPRPGEAGRWVLSVACFRSDGGLVTMSDTFRERPSVADLDYTLDHLDPTWTLVSVRTDWRA